MSIGRNDPCWCGSGVKYKKCHLDFDSKITAYALKGFEVPDFDAIRNIEELEGIRASAAINTAVLDHVAANIKVGMSTDDINTLVHDFTIAQGAIPAPLDYEGFPKSVCRNLPRTLSQ